MLLPAHVTTAQRTTQHGKKYQRIYDVEMSSKVADMSKHISVNNPGILQSVG